MAEASWSSVFNSKVASFNEAANSGDTYALGETGAELIRSALDECCKVGVNGTLKDKYRKTATAVADHMAKRLKSPAAPARMGGAAGGEDAEGGNDPYYTPKKWFSDEVPKMNFTNIIGVQEVKDAFMVDVVAPLRPEFRELYQSFRGDQVGTNILLYGPPGTGKTHIVRCLAGALGCKYAVVLASEILASVVGVAEKNVRDVFAQAEELDRSIIFIDEIDSLCSDRGSDDSRNTKSVLTTFLTCMDGFTKNKKEGQLRIVIAATNRPWALDAALKRGGRFETQIYVPLPDQVARETFVAKALTFPHDADVTAKDLATKLAGYSGADINAIMKQIANRPLRRAVSAKLKGDAKTASEQRATKADCEAVIRDYINSIDQEMLLRFAAYDRGVSYEALLQEMRKQAAAGQNKN